MLRLPYSIPDFQSGEGVGGKWGYTLFFDSSVGLSKDSPCRGSRPFLGQVLTPQRRAQFLCCTRTTGHLSD